MGHSRHAGREFIGPAGGGFPDWKALNPGERTRDKTAEPCCFLRSDMQLSAELWKALLGSIRCEQQRRVPEKRKNPRIQLRARICLAPANPERATERSIEVWTRDVSAQGISFTSSRCFKPQEQFLIDLPRRRGAPLRLLATVRQSRKLADRVYYTGLIHQLVESTAQPSQAA